jgi:glycosyltransferase involved in cell wall biosynthesis
MAAGTPIIAGDNAGYVTTMKNTGAISLVNPQDTIDFARRLELLLLNEEIRLVWQKWAKEYVKQFDYKNIVTLYEDLYKKALKKHVALQKA